MTHHAVTAPFDHELLDHKIPDIDKEKLEKYCQQIYSIVGRESIDNEPIQDDTVSAYYKISRILYRHFHSLHGAMHLPIAESPSQKHHEKLLFQAKAIGHFIQKNSYKQVLELGCGMGFNGNYLAKKLVNVQFTALDLTPANLRFAKKNASASGNIHFLQQNFDELALNSTYDLIYSVETLCHSKDIGLLIKKLSKQLNPGGRIIIFDGYIKSKARNLETSVEKKAYKLMSWGFAMERFQTINEVLEAADQSGLQIVQTTDFSKNVLSNLLAFQKGAMHVLNYTWLLKALTRLGILPNALIKQITAGLLSAYFVRINYIGYYQIELKKGLQPQ